MISVISWVIALAGAVILQLERVNHIGGALGGGIHGGHAGALLGAIAFGHGTEDHAVHVDGGHLLEHRPRIGEQLNLAMGIAQCGRSGAKWERSSGSSCSMTGSAVRAFWILV